MHRLASRFGRLFTFNSKPSTGSVLRASISATGVAAAAATMVAYSSVVSKLETAADVPEDARLASHHVKGSHGKTVKFKNPHPSAGDTSATVLQMLGKIIW
jgi:hypothetical protein